MPHQRSCSRAPAGRPTARRVVAGGLAAAAAVAGLAAGPVTAASSASASTTAIPLPGPSLAGWGLDFFDQLGDGRSGMINGVDAHSTTPVVATITGQRIVRATTGCDHTTVLTSRNQLLSWGDNSRGQLGNGRTSGPGLTTAQRVLFLFGATVADVQATCQSTTVLTSDGRVLAWGDNSRGQLGNGHADGLSVFPRQVPLPRTVRVTAISTSDNYTLALTSSGQVWAWGESAGELAGQIPNTPIVTPTQVSFPAGTVITAVAAGFSHALFLTSTGQVLAVGANSVGQLGTGVAGAIGNDKFNGSATPVPVALKPGTTVTAIAAGQGHSLALTSTGQVLAWGEDSGGQLGDGAALPAKAKATPGPVALPPGTRVASISTHASFSLALTSTGQVWSWGRNDSGELGTGSASAASSVPALVTIPGNLSVTGVATGVTAETGYALVRPATRI